MTRPEKERPHLLIAEDDARFGQTLKLEFDERLYEVSWIKSSSELEALNISSLEFALVDLRLGSESGLVLVDLIKKRWPDARIVMLTGYGSIPTAVEAMKRGAAHYLTKPAKVNEIERALWGDETSIDSNTYPGTTLAQQERDFIESTLLQCDGNISVAAKRLGVHRQSLQRKLRKFSSSPSAIPTIHAKGNALD